MSKKATLPDDISQQIAAAEKARGLPPGTLASIVQQETAGNTGAYLADPSKYHYEANAEGKRIAKHSGKESTAFGPFGIVESTARDPGYGVKPLADKTFGEQLRFAGDYLVARSKQAGSLEGGLAGYGEGAKYAKDVIGRSAAPPMAAAGAPSLRPVTVNQDPVVLAGAASPGDVAAPPEMQASAPLPPELVAALNPRMPAMATQPTADEWTKFLSAMPAPQRQVAVADIDYGSMGPRASGVRPMQNRVPNFQAFQNWKGQRA